MKRNNLYHRHKSQLISIIIPPIRKDAILTKWPKYCLIIIAIKLNNPIPKTKPPAKPSITHALSVPANMQNIIEGNRNAAIPIITKKTYPTGCSALNFSSDEALK